MTRCEVTSRPGVPSARPRTRARVPQRLAWVVAAMLVFALHPVTLAAFSSTTSNSANTLSVSTSFGLTQNVGGVTGCISNTGSAGACTNDGRDTSTLLGLDISDDGANVIAASKRDTADGGIHSYVRNAATGVLTQQAGSSSCVTNSGDGGSCVNGETMRNAATADISPDGKHVYVPGYTSWAVAVITRNTSTGALSQPAHATNDCISENGSDGSAGTATCTNGHGMYNPTDVVVSHDNQHVYSANDATDGASGSVAIFDRNTTTGALSQDATSAGCISDTGAGTCVDGRGLASAYSIGISPDDKNVYVTSRTGHSVAVFARNTSTGDLTQLAGTAGCVNETGTDGCADGQSMQGIRRMIISPDGANAYASTATSDGVVVFDRNTTTGALTQKAGTAGCWTETGAGGCTDGQLMDNNVGVAVAPDNQDVYTASPLSEAINTFRRNPATGALSQASSTAKCVTDTGNGGVCYDGRGVGDQYNIIVSPDGLDVYSPNYSDGGIIFLKRAR